MKKYLIHSSYHKCLTVLFKKVISKSLDSTFRKNEYKHFNGVIEDFYREKDNFKIISVNNNWIDKSKFNGTAKISRFVRDPRDLIISGYFYHKRGAEDWCNIKNPSTNDFDIVNGTIPDDMIGDLSYSEYLNKISKEDGLIAEIKFRKKHFDSMMLWDNDDSDIKVFKYEDILGNEVQIFKEISDFYNLDFFTKKAVNYYSNKLSFKKIKNTKHIRNPKPSQWKDHFTPNVTKYFNKNHPNLLEKLGYL